MNKHWSTEEKRVLAIYITRLGTKEGIDEFAKQSPRTGTAAYKKYRSLLNDGEWDTIISSLTSATPKKKTFWERLKSLFKRG